MTGITLSGENRELVGLAEKINAISSEAESCARNATMLAVAAGELLVQAKVQIEHGNWEAWLLDNCRLAVRTAQAYMRLASAFPMLTEDKRNAVAEMPVRMAVRAITTIADAPPRPRGVAIQRSECARVASVLRKGAADMREAARWIGALGECKGPRVARLRRKLADAIALIDGLTVVEEVSS